jgi:hypothetical protein
MLHYPKLNLDSTIGVDKAGALLWKAFLSLSMDPIILQCLRPHRLQLPFERDEIKRAGSLCPFSMELTVDSWREITFRRNKREILISFFHFHFISSPVDFLKQEWK